MIRTFTDSAAQDMSLAAGPEVSAGFGNRTPDFGIFPLSGGFQTLVTFGDAVDSLVLTLRGRTFSIVRALLAFVRRLLTLVGDPVPLVGDEIPFVGELLASNELDLPLSERVLAFLQAAADHLPIKRLKDVSGGITLAAAEAPSAPPTRYRVRVREVAAL